MKETASGFFCYRFTFIKVLGQNSPSMSLIPSWEVQMSYQTSLGPLTQCYQPTSPSPTMKYGRGGTT